MCTVTLSYNQNDVQAQQTLDALLKTGLFTQIFVNDAQVEIDQLQDMQLNSAEEAALQTFMNGAKQRIPQRNMSLSEAYQVAMGEIKSLYTGDGISI